MEDYYDVTESLFSAKANEGMIAFSGFLAGDASSPCEGVLKISAFRRPDGSGYLTLTFVIDLEGGRDGKAGLEARFSRADQGTLAERLGPDFDMLLEVPLNPFAESPRFFVDELNLYFKRLAGRERFLLEDRVLPVLSDLLVLRFDALEWLDASAGGGSTPASAAALSGSDSALARRLKQQLAEPAGQPRAHRSGEKA